MGPFSRDYGMWLYAVYIHNYILKCMFCRLVQDRELSLLDGTRLLSQERYTLARTAAGLSEEEMAERYGKELL